MHRRASFSYTRLAVPLFLLASLMCAPGAVRAQLGPLVEAARAIEAAEDAARAAQLATDAAKIGKVSEAVSVASRAERGISLAQTARAVLTSPAVARLIERSSADALAYVGLEKGAAHLIAVSRTVEGETAVLTRSFDVHDVGAVLHQVYGDQVPVPVDVFVEGEVFNSSAFEPSSLPKSARVHRVDPDGNIVSTTLRRRNGELHSYVNWNESGTLYVDARDPFVRETLEQLSALTFSTADVRILGLFDEHADLGTVSALADAGRHHGVQAFLGSRPNLERVFRQSRGKSLLIVGHHVGGEFVVVGADGSAIFRVADSELRALANEHYVTTFLLGCATGPGGFAREVNSLDVVAQLDRSLRAKSYADFFARLGSRESPFLITAEQVGTSRRLVVERLDEIRRVKTATGEAIGSTEVLNVAGPTPAMQILNAGAAILRLGVGGLILAAMLSLMARSTKPLEWYAAVLAIVPTVLYSGARAGLKKIAMTFAPKSAAPRTAT